ncbi:MAG: C40 family peptidase [Acidobacteria bacterium]|nr:C40 family peptidase [Acidobacteriota bacterium]
MPAWLLAFLSLSPDAVVVSPVANMYSKPTLDADVVSQAIYASPVLVIESQSDWAKIRTSDDYTGWVSQSALLRLKAGERPYASTGKVATVEALMAHLYREPSVTKHAPLLTVPYETRLEVVAEPEADKKRWLQVRLPDDRSGYIQRGDITFDLKTLDIPAVIALGKRFQGLPYTWGGTSAFGFDCSGYTQMLCRRLGKQLPRDAQPQAHSSAVTPVNRDDLRPGDLLYFGNSKRITHTGMYIGAGEFIHATAHDRPVVQISRLDDAYWTSIHVASRRLK